MKERDWIQQKIHEDFNEFIKEVSRARLTKEGLEYQIFGEKVKKIKKPDEDMKSASKITKTILNFFEAYPQYVIEIVEAQDGNA